MPKICLDLGHDAQLYDRSLVTTASGDVEGRTGACNLVVLGDLAGQMPTQSALASNVG